MQKEVTKSSRGPRIPFAGPVEVRFEDFGEFVTEYAKDLSLNGMFLHTTRPHPPGTAFQFEFEVAGGQPLIRGVAEVVWVREPRRAAGETPGMGVRFVSLDSQGQKLVRWLIERTLAAGGKTFELSS